MLNYFYRIAFDATATARVLRGRIYFEMPALFQQLGVGTQEVAA
jgi:hypothetical protein